MNKNIIHVGHINQLYLCMGCGACCAICPVGAIQLVLHKGQFYPEVNSNCIGCKKCLEVCPGIEIIALVVIDESKYQNFRWD